MSGRVMILFTHFGVKLIYLKIKVDTLWNKEVRVKNTTIKKNVQFSGRLFWIYYL